MVMVDGDEGVICLMWWGYKREGGMKKNEISIPASHN